MPTVVLIDAMGNAQTRVVPQALIRTSVAMPVPQAMHVFTGRERDRDVASIAYTTVHFRDSGYVDHVDHPILTPDGQPPRLEKSGTRGFKRGRQLYAKVYISELDLREARTPPRELAWDAAQPLLREMAKGADLACLDVKVDILNPSTLTTRFIVYAEERIPA